ncbi:hypothetical protein CH75_08930 [Dyella jiangningensis]|nr:hypothetical protein CH75_08930 [Dyella jiangningensis]
MVHYGHPSLRGAGLKNIDGWDDLFLYSIERSHLHTCLLAANAITSIWRGTEGAAAALCLEMLTYWSSSWLYMSSDKGERLFLEPSRRELTFVRVDATHVMKQTVCSGLEPYYRALRRKLRSVSTYNPRTLELETLNMEDQLRARASEEIDHLPPMEYDWIFYDAAGPSQMRLWQCEARRARACMADMKTDPFEFVQRGINSRSAASASSLAR